MCLYWNTECGNYLYGSHIGLGNTHRLEMCLKSERMGVQYTNPVLFFAGFRACAESRCSGTHPSLIPKDNVFKTLCRTMHWASRGKIPKTTVFSVLTSISFELLSPDCGLPIFLPHSWRIQGAQRFLITTHSYNSFQWWRKDQALIRETENRRLESSGWKALRLGEQALLTGTWGVCMGDERHPVLSTVLWWRWLARFCV